MLNYTHLHAFTAFYHLFLGGNVTRVKNGRVGKIRLFDRRDIGRLGSACRLLPPFAMGDEVEFRWIKANAVLLYAGESGR